MFIEKTGNLWPGVVLTQKPILEISLIVPLEFLQHFLRLLVMINLNCWSDSTIESTLMGWGQCPTSIISWHLHELCWIFQQRQWSNLFKLFNSMSLPSSFKIKIFIPYRASYMASTDSWLLFSRSDQPTLTLMQLKLQLATSTTSCSDKITLPGQELR